MAQWVMDSLGGLSSTSFIHIHFIHRLTQIPKSFVLFGVIFPGFFVDGIYIHGVGDTLSPELYLWLETA